jgi:hypothetical protein
MALSRSGNLQMKNGMNTVGTSSSITVSSRMPELKKGWLYMNDTPDAVETLRGLIEMVKNSGSLPVRLRVTWPSFLGLMTRLEPEHAPLDGPGPWWHMDTFGIPVTIDNSMDTPWALDFDE